MKKGFRGLHLDAVVFRDSFSAILSIVLFAGKSKDRAEQLLSGGGRLWNYFRGSVELLCRLTVIGKTNVKKIFRMAHKQGLIPLYILKITLRKEVVR